jgi:NAD(P)-dependent dehydrogenase (short-subunit alcohol dehydrogenase family)
VNIQNKTVLITGANRGIGRALVKEALRRGASRVYAGVRGGATAPADERVTPLTLDVNNAVQIEEAAVQVDDLDVLINNAGVAKYDDLTNIAVLSQHLEVNLFGPLRMIHAFLPKLKRSKGAIVNNLSMAGLAPIPAIPSYSISKAAAFNMSQSVRALLANDGVRIHTVVLGPIDTEMSRGLDIPKTSPDVAAAGIFDGVERGEEEIFPDPVAHSIAEGWHTGALKALERQFAAFLPENTPTVA